LLSVERVVAARLWLSVLVVVSMLVVGLLRYWLLVLHRTVEEPPLSFQDRQPHVRSFGGRLVVLKGWSIRVLLSFCGEAFLCSKHLNIASNSVHPETTHQVSKSSRMNCFWAYKGIVLSG
jgi:hypothetical protein